MNYLDLLFQPRRFFSDELIHSKNSAVLVASWLLGIACVAERIDFKLMEAQLQVAAIWRRTEIESVASSWAMYWAALLLGGAFAAVFGWLVGGWWFRKRLLWSNAVALTAERARRRYGYHALVYTFPCVAVTVVQTVLFESYLAAWKAEEDWSTVIALIPIVFLFASCWTGYIAATVSFRLSPPKAKLWFAVLPAMFYVFSMGLLTFLFAGCCR